MLKKVLISAVAAAAATLGVVGVAHADVLGDHGLSSVRADDSSDSSYGSDNDSDYSNNSDDNDSRDDNGYNSDYDNGYNNDYGNDNDNRGLTGGGLTGGNNGGGLLGGLGN